MGAMTSFGRPFRFGRPFGFRAAYPGGGGAPTFGPVINLADPAVAGDGYRVTQSDGLNTRTVYSDGTNYYDAADDSLVAPWWLPYGATMHVDFVNGRFYWNGAVKALSDLTSLGDGTYTLPWDSIGATWTGDITLQSEVVLGPDPAVPSGRYFGWYVNNSNEFYTEARGVNTDAWRYWQSLNAKPTNGSGGNRIEARAADYTNDTLISFAGVNRSVMTAASGKVKKSIWSNGEMLQTTATDAALAAPVGRLINFGREAFTGGSKASNVTMRKFTLWMRELSEPYMRLANNISLTRPIHLLGDSFLNTGQILMRLKASAEAAGHIIGWSQDGVGGSTLAEQATRFALSPGAWGSTLVIVDGATELDGPGSVAAIQDMVSRLTHDDWVYVQSNPINPLGDSRRDDWQATQDAILAYAGADHYVETLAPMIAADTTNEAQGLWGPTMTGDLTHPTNPAGYDVFAGIIEDALIARGLR